jgi:internalin A
VYWKYGAWVYEKGAGCRVLIEKHMHDNRRGGIKLQIQGRSHQDLARWLRERIEARNSQFGHQDLVPSIDELDALAPLPHRGRVPVGGFAEPGTRPSFTLQAGVNVDPTIGGPPTAPTFEKPPASLFPRHSKQVFVSYAWGDGTDAGKQRSKIVDDLCDALRKAGAQVHRDSTEMRPGDRISEFMNRLAGGDHVVVVISDKYLRSENCMYELFQIFRNCAADPKRFVRRIIPLVLPDAALDSIPHRLARAKYWVEQHAQLRPEIQKNVDAVGNEVFKKYKLIGEFARNTSDMLEHLIDILEPRDFDRMAKEGFREILAQIRE